MQLGTIAVSDLRREFRTARRREGLRGAWQGLWQPQYQTKAAVDGINFTIVQGEIVGYIGANGAGKSTTIKMLTGIVVPTGGTILVNGRDPQADRYAHTRDIGVVFGQRTQLWWDLPVIEALRLLQTVFAVDTATFTQRLARFDEVLGLGELLHTPVRKLSLGQRMRCDLAASLIHQPPVVFLDEPTIGLDVAVKAQIRQFIQAINKEIGTTFVLTTHDLGDIEALCRRVMVIDGGKLIYDGDLSRMKGSFGQERILVFDLATPLTIAAISEAVAMPALQWEQTAPERLTCRFDGLQANPAAIVAAVMQQADVRDLSLLETDIETIVKRIYRHGYVVPQVPGGPIGTPS
ncbi:MAG: ATP-binding cassette domain-containing protein [Candidatus Sericytochromatia bacterium]|nr:ATP-binding cassette domain-containing protein [Candidatus Sericytochromatia bacterium]